MTTQIGRNTLCPCDSGIKYKYCCIIDEKQTRSVKVKNICNSCGNNSYLTIDLNDDLLGSLSLSSITRPIKIFCKDNSFYFFQIMALSDLSLLNEKLANDNLQKTDLIIAVFSRMRGNKILERLTVQDSNTPHSCDYRYNVYKNCMTLEFTKRTLNDACNITPIFEKRRQILEDAIDAGTGIV